MSVETGGSSAAQSATQEVISPPLASAPAAAMTTEAAIEALLRAAQNTPDIQLLPWLEREFTLYAMKATKGNQVRAAKLLGITRELTIS